MEEKRKKMETIFDDTGRFVVVRKKTKIGVFLAPLVMSICV